MMWRKAFFFALLFLNSVSLFAADKIRIVATTSTIASLAGEIAGDLADIHYVASAKRDVHFVAPNPKDVLNVKKADVFIHGGLDLEAWRQPLLDAAGNPAFLGEGKRAIDVSRGIRLLEVPESLSRAEGDIHVFGNPHYWLDPENGKMMANQIAQSLSQLYPQHADQFRMNLKAFEDRFGGKLADWKRRLEPFQGTALIGYHKCWPYFAERFGFEMVGELEPKPGIPPTAKHIAEILRLIAEKNVKAIVTEPFRESATPEKIAKESGVPVIVLTQSVYSEPGVDSYISMIEYNVRRLEEALR